MNESIRKHEWKWLQESVRALELALDGDGSSVENAITRVRHELYMMEEAIKYWNPDNATAETSLEKMGDL